MMMPSILFFSWLSQSSPCIIGQKKKEKIDVGSAATGSILNTVTEMATFSSGGIHRNPHDNNEKLKPIMISNRSTDVDILIKSYCICVSNLPSALITSSLTYYYSTGYKYKKSIFTGS